VLVAAGRFAAFGALLALVLTVIFMIGLLERRDRTVLRMGIDSLAAFPVYVAGVIVLYTLR
jgi:cation:H+ antiporter